MPREDILGLCVSKARSAWHTWVERVTRDLEPGLAVRIRTANRAALLTRGVIIAYFVVFLCFGQVEAAILLVPAMLWYAALPFLARRQLFSWARGGSLAIGTGTVFALAVFFGRGCGVHLLLFSAAAAPLAIYEPHERKAIAVGFLLPAAAGICFSLLPYHLDTIDSGIEHIFYPVMMAQTFLQLLHLLWALAQEMRRYQQLLIGANQSLKAEMARSAELESHLENGRRVQALGELAAGVAHEINTPLQYVADGVAFIDRTGRRLLALGEDVERVLPELEPRHRDGLEASIKRLRLPRLRDEHMKAWVAVEQGLARVSELVVALKALASTDSELRPSDLNAILRDAVLVARGKWAQVGELECELQADLPDVPVVAGELGQVFLNLISNAADAIADRPQAGGRGKIWVRSRCTGDHVEVEVEDTGCGIADDIKNRVFEPFFTTKEVGRGSGQGLSLAYTSVVRRHGGKLSFDSTPGSGSVFRVTLPVSPWVAPAGAAQKPPAEGGPHAGAETQLKRGVSPAELVQGGSLGGESEASGCS